MADRGEGQAVRPRRRAHGARRPARVDGQGGLTVAVTGPTGDLGIALVDALERQPRVKRIVGMARREFDPGSRSWRKTEYRQGDVQDDESVRDAVDGADVVVHLAFAIVGGGDQSHEINVEGSRRVFQAAVDAGAQRICYASSVAAYGFYRDNPEWIDEDVPARGSDSFYYSRHKAEVERVVGEVLAGAAGTRPYLFRPCIVAGPKARMLLEELPYLRAAALLPEPVRRLFEAVPGVRPVLPDPGVPFQLVHEGDVASAFVAGVLGKGRGGAYDLAGRGTLTMKDLAGALGWYALPVPELAVDMTAEVVARLPGAPEAVAWIEALRTPVLMNTARAERELGWQPRHSGIEVLRSTLGREN